MRPTIRQALGAFVLCSAALAQIPTVTANVIGGGPNGLHSPLFACSPPGDVERLFVVERPGRIKVRTPANASGIWTTVLDISTEVGLTGEQGLLGMAFHPDFASNGWFYINYNPLLQQATIIKRYTIPAGSDVANPTSGVTLLTIGQPFNNHKGGSLLFGPDGYLYVPLGDGGSGNDPNGHAQDIDSLLGKVLRLDVSNPNPPHYVSPPTNPYFGPTPGLDEIWAVGLRNPFRCSFDRLTGDLWMGDVGQETLEEIDFQPATDGSSYAGRNYGWRCREGTQCTGLSCTTTCSPTAYVEPVVVAPTGTAGAIIGGYVYRGCAIPQLRGWYFYGYLATGSVFRLQYDGTTVTGPVDAGFTIPGIVSFGEDGNGELYACNLGQVYKIVPTTPQMVGVVSYGTGTPGCLGPSLLSLGCSPTIFNPGETLISTNGPAGTTGVAVVGAAALPAGSDPLGVAVETLVDLTPFTYTLWEFPVGAGGVTILPAPIPKMPSLVGSIVFAQEFFIWSGCMPSPSNLSSTHGLEVTVQP